MNDPSPGDGSEASTNISHALTLADYPKTFRFGARLVLLRL
jgi:hypothetical protein